MTPIRIPARPFKPPAFIIMKRRVALFWRQFWRQVLHGLREKEERRSRPTPPGEGTQAWRILLPRAAEFSPRSASAFLSGLAPLLRQSPPLTLEIRSEGGSLTYRINGPATLEASLADLLAAWIPGARLDRRERSEDPRRTDAEERKDDTRGGTEAKVAKEGGEGQRWGVSLHPEKPEIFPLEGERDLNPLLGFLRALEQSPAPAGLWIRLSLPPGDWERWKRAAAEALARGETPPPRGWGLLPSRFYGWIRESQGFPPPVASRRTPPQGSSSDGLPKLRSPVLEASVVVWATDLLALFDDPSADTDLTDGTGNMHNSGRSGDSPQPVEGRGGGSGAERAQRLAAILTEESATGTGAPLNRLLPSGRPFPFPSPDSSPDSPAARMALTPREVALLFHVPEPAPPSLLRDPTRRVPMIPRALPLSLDFSPEMPEMPEKPERPERPEMPAPERGSGSSDVSSCGASGGGGLRLGDAYTPRGWTPLWISPEERRLHLYLLGQTGTGKSTLLASLIAQDLEAGRGVGLLDPHGDLCRAVLSLVPPSRAPELLHFRPADAEYPLNLNPLSGGGGDPYLTASVMISVLKKLYADFFGPRLEHLLRNGLLALLATPTPSLVLLPRLLMDREFREHYVLPFVSDPVVRGFFTEELDRMDSRFRAEALSPLLNKVGAFLSVPMIRNLIGGVGAGWDARACMDGGGVFLADLSGIGEEAAHLLGGTVVALFELAARSRSDTPEEGRRDFTLYIDECHRFAHEGFATLLSEARKYRLSLGLAHQYLDQLPPPLQSAVLGNVGTLACFRLGPSDAPRLAKELAPAFGAEDLVNLPRFEFAAKAASAAGGVVPPFTARARQIELPPRDVAPLVEASRRRWGRPRAVVEVEIRDLWEGRLS